MKVNSEKGLAQGRETLKQHGGSWTNVREAGTKRKDGVVVVPRSTPDAGSHKPKK